MIEQKTLVNHWPVIKTEAKSLESHQQVTGIRESSLKVTGISPFREKALEDDWKITEIVKVLDT